MGIKFRCPKGHKLNVKSFLAGKRGVCPDCGATFRIPPEPGGSDIQAVAIPSVKGTNGADDAVAVAAAPQATARPAAVGRPAAPVAAVPVAAVAYPAVAYPAAAPTGVPLPVQPAAMPAMVAAPAVMPAMPAALPATGMPPAPLPRPAAPPGAAAPSDPIAEAPAAIWYVRPPSGGQYGPARGDVMRRWLAEGRVSAESLVWREGWADWQAAGKLFSMLGAASAAAAPAAAVVAPVAARTAARYSARKKGGSGLAIAALVGLVLVCLVLVVVLVVVLAQQSA